jgi:type I restriction enzyme, S subunit
MKAGWQMVKFGEIAENIAIRVKPAEANSDIYVGLEHLDPESLHLRKWGHPSDVEGDKLRFWKGDIIFGRRRAYQRKLAVAAFDGICSAHAMVLRAKPKIILPECLPFFLQSDMFMERAIGISVGSLSPTINWKTLREEKFPLPPLDEQKRSAGIFWAADEAVERYKDVLRAHEAYMGTLFDHELTSGEAERTLVHYCSKDGVKIGPFGSILHVKDYQLDGVPVVMPSDIAGGNIKEDNIARISEKKAMELDGYRLAEGDILFPRRGDLTKRAMITKAQTGWLCGTGTIRVRVEGTINRKAIYFAVTNRATNTWLDRYSVGTTMQNLNAKTIENIPLRLPSLEQCEVIVAQAEKMQLNIETIHKHLLLLQELRKTLESDLFAGHQGSAWKSDTVK